MHGIVVSFLGLCLACGYGYDYSTSKVEHEQTSTSFQFDPVKKLPLFNHDTCYCNSEVHVVSNTSSMEHESIPEIVCHCQHCIAHGVDASGSPAMRCDEDAWTEDEYRGLLDLRTAIGDRRKRTPFNFVEYLQKLSLMGSHDSSHSTKGGAYFSYNYGGQNQGNRRKRAPFNFEELLKKISVMRSHESSNSRKTGGYFGYNYNGNQNQGNRRKRAPFDFAEFIKKISIMGSHDSSHNTRNQGYIHYNYVNSSANPTSGGSNSAATSTTPYNEIDDPMAK